jgi:folate-binding Fe-S cluster repair protein YgfZ
MLNLDRCGAVSFEKGCYTGQEIVARTEHRGRSKRRTLRFDCDVPQLAIGDSLNDAGTDIGTVVNATGNECLAVVPLESADKTLSIRGHTASPRPLPYSVND